jgi:DNA-binding GntR family transcriptional regulator
MSSLATLHRIASADPHLPDSPEERMYVDIYGAIMEHRLPAGTKLTEQTLVDIYGLARYNVRRVLARLASDGLIELERNRGAFIASPTEQEAQDMFEIRQVLEQSVMSKLVCSGPAEFKAMHRLVERERAAYMQGNRPLWIRLSADFHIELAKMGGNALLVETLRRLVSRTTLMISTQTPPDRQPCSFDEHLAVISALERRDEAGAIHAMAHHLGECACRIFQRPNKKFDLRAALGKPRGELSA